MRCFLNKQLFLLRTLPAASCLTFLSKPRATDNMFWWCHVNSYSFFMLCRCLSHRHRFLKILFNTCSLRTLFSHSHQTILFAKSWIHASTVFGRSSWVGRFLFCVRTPTQNAITRPTSCNDDSPHRVGQPTNYQHTQPQSHFDSIVFAAKNSEKVTQLSLQKCVKLKHDSCSPKTQKKNCV